MIFGSTIPLPIVCATCSGNTTKATKLKKAAQTTAGRGDSTRVDTTVAIEFAASWKPLMKSKASAITTIATTSNIDAAQLFSRTTPSMMLATSSHLSVADSSVS